jgi:hypothetical protein
MCYFALTTLSTVGYGDYTPVTIREIYIGIFYMLIGIVVFSQIIQSFIQIIQNYDSNKGDNVNDGSELHNWTLLIARFASKPLAPALISQIDSHFSHSWAQSRLSGIQMDDEYLTQCPRSVKHHVLLHYLFDDIIFRFRTFFMPRSHSGRVFDENFLFEVSFGLRPDKFDIQSDDKLILDEEDEVTDMHFVLEGKVGIGYYLMT